MDTQPQRECEFTKFNESRFSKNTTWRRKTPNFSKTERKRSSGQVKCTDCIWGRGPDISELAGGESNSFNPLVPSPILRRYTITPAAITGQGKTSQNKKKNSPWIYKVFLKYWGKFFFHSCKCFLLILDEYCMRL